MINQIKNLNSKCFLEKNYKIMNENKKIIFNEKIKIDSEGLKELIKLNYQINILFLDEYIINDTNIHELNSILYLNKTNLIKLSLKRNHINFKILENNLKNLNQLVDLNFSYIKIINSEDYNIFNEMIFKNTNLLSLKMKGTFVTSEEFQIIKKNIQNHSTLKIFKLSGKNI
jgi:hypothetical protein